ncbi:MAG TPA: DegT/DnrJ/EryC1/StrS family aminotransferase [Salinivirgaceae bacterium]|nr:DegT/DnrJ/EryC1/StrS family aminotransferase [Salinivirgaceae bacterium]
MIPLVKPFMPPKDMLMPRLEAILYSGYIAEGEATLKFEETFGQLIKNPLCLSTNSGTAALHIALLLTGAGPGTEVISTALTAEPTNTTIALTGAKVVFADVNPRNGLIDPKSIEEKITEKTKAICVVHYAGMVCDLEKISAISKKYNIPVIEDAAHAFYAKWHNSFIGNISPYTIFSFQAIKHITTVDGGMLCLNNGEEYTRARKLRWFGLDKKIPRLENNITEPGYKYHMNNVNATIGLTQLEHLTTNVFRYIENGKYFDQTLRNIPGLTLVEYSPNSEPSYWLYTVLVENREGFIQKLREHGIESSILHLRNDRHEIFKKNMNYQLPNLDYFYNHFVHIPCGWWVDESSREMIAETIKSGW